MPDPLHIGRKYPPHGVRISFHQQPALGDSRRLVEWLNVQSASLRGERPEDRGFPARPPKHREIDLRRIANQPGNSYRRGMGILEIEREALAPPDQDRASSAARLLKALPRSETDVSDEEVEWQERELHSGEIKAIPHEEFGRAVRREREA